MNLLPAPRPRRLLRRLQLAISITSMLSVVAASSALYFGYLGLAETEAVTADRDRLLHSHHL